MSEFWRYILIVFCVLIGVLVVAPGVIFAERRLLGFWQERYGPNRVGPFGILQLLADMIKLMAKEDWTAPFSDRAVFIIAPGIVVAATLLTFAIIGFSPGIQIANLNIGVLFFLGLSSLAVYSIMLGGWASNNKYALLSALRAAGQMLSYEVFMGLSLMGVVIMAGSFNLGQIVKAQQHMWFCVPQILGLGVFIVAGFAEARRIPFDLPEAENELVAGFHTEYSGMKFGMFFLGEYIGITLISALITALFLGGWLGPVLPPIVWFVGKTMVLVGFFILVRGALPRPRYDQLMSFGWKFMLPLSLLNLLATGFFVLWFR